MAGLKAEIQRLAVHEWAHALALLNVGIVPFRVLTGIARPRVEFPTELIRHPLTAHFVAVAGAVAERYFGFTRNVEPSEGDIELALSRGIGQGTRRVAERLAEMLIVRHEAALKELMDAPGVEFSRRHLAILSRFGGPLEPWRDLLAQFDQVPVPAPPPRSAGRVGRRRLHRVETTSLF